VEGILFLALTWVGVGTVLAGWLSRDLLAAFWREPVLKFPALIIESDDWGAGPPEQSERLARIAAVLESYADAEGRKPVMTLGLVLRVADGARIVADQLRRYHCKSLDQVELAPTLAAIRRGAESGVFALQLHGGEHYWPASLLAAARSDAKVASWLAGAGLPSTEALPAALQSRWIDAARLPSRPLPADEIRTAALDEAASFRGIVGRLPAVAVPPTFIWDDAVEAAWAEAGVRFVVTPGRRYRARGADGAPGAADRSVLNGDKGAGGITYLVRDDYFEPARGHTAERAFTALAAKTRVGRPTLLETHRANFLGDSAAADAAIAELDRLLAMALRAFPGVVFLSTEALALHLCRRDPWLVERGLAARLHIWLRRLWSVTRLRKLAWLTGALVPAWILYVATRRAACAPGMSSGG
jgi:hypothetical protein